LAENRFHRCKWDKVLSLNAASRNHCKKHGFWSYILGIPGILAQIYAYNLHNTTAPFLLYFVFRLVVFDLG
jgi:hypothetical protein